MQVHISNLPVEGKIMRGRLMIIQVQSLNLTKATLPPLDHTLDYLLHIVEARTA